MSPPRPDRRAALAAEIAARLAAIESAFAALRPLAAELAAFDDAPAAAKPGKLLPIAEAAKLARVSLDTARRRAKERGKRGKDGALYVDPADLADRRYARPGGA